MAQTLDEFIAEAKEKIVSFEKMWREKNTETPENYPLEMPDGNDGLWWEFFNGSDN